MRTYRIAALLFLLLAAIPQAGRADLPPVTARQLVQTVDEALAGAAEVAKGIDRRNPRYAPFWSALQAMRTRVSRIGAALGSGEFFLLVDQGSSDLGELRVAWARMGVRNDEVAARLRTASTSYRSLRSTFGREGVRLKQGGPLTAAESQQLARLQASERRFAARAQRLRDQAQRRRDAATAAEMERFRAEAESISQASADLASYLNALNAASEVRGEWQADRPYVRKTAPPADLAAADATVEDLYTDADIGQVFAVDLGKTAEGPSGELQVASGEGATPKVVVFQPGEAAPEAVVEPIANDDEDEGAEPAEAVEGAEGEPAEGDAAVSAPAPEAPKSPVAPKIPGAAEGDAQTEAASAPATPTIPPPIG